MKGRFLRKSLFCYKGENMDRKAGNPLLPVVDIMTGRNLKITAIDRYMYSGKEGNHDPHPLSPWVSKKLKDIYI